MKKTFLTVATLATTIIATQLNAQAYVRAGLGYNTPANTQVLGVNTKVVNLDKTTSNNYGTMGGGLNVGLGVGFGLTEHLAVDLGFDYLMGEDVTIRTDDYTIGLGNQKVTATGKASLMRLTPSLILSAGKKKLSPYAKFGVTLPVGGKIEGTITDVSTSPLGTSTTITKTERKGSMTLGYVAGVGLAYKLTDKLTLSGELQYLGLNVPANTRTVISKMKDNVAVDMTVSDKETEYVDEVKPTDNKSASESTKALKEHSNFNALGLNVGIKYNF